MLILASGRYFPQEKGRKGERAIHTKVSNMLRVDCWTMSGLENWPVLPLYKWEGNLGGFLLCTNIQAADAQQR